MKITRQDEIQKLFDNIKSRIEKDTSAENVKTEEFVSKVKLISFNNKYALWIIQKYLNNEIQRYEDFDRVKTALSYFHRYKQKLDLKERNIMNIKSLIDLENLVEPFAELDKQKELEKLQKDKIYSETKILYDGPEGKILVPLSKDASIFWGKGTKWCTASVGIYNYFEHYNEKGSLYIFILPEKDSEGREIKYQLHLESDQFMNMEDQEVIAEKLSKKDFALFKKFMSVFDIEKQINVFNKMNSYQKDMFVENTDNLIDYIDKNKDIFNYLSDDRQTLKHFKKTIFSFVPVKKLNNQIIDAESLLLSLLNEKSRFDFLSVDKDKLTEDVLLFAAKNREIEFLEISHKFSLEEKIIEYFFENANLFAIIQNQVFSNENSLNYQFYLEQIDNLLFKVSPEKRMIYISNLAKEYGYFPELPDKFSQNEIKNIIDILVENNHDVVNKLFYHGYEEYLSNEVISKIFENTFIDDYYEIKSSDDLFGFIAKRSYLTEKNKGSHETFRKNFLNNKDKILDGVKKIKSFAMLKFFGKDKQYSLIEDIINDENLSPKFLASTGFLKEIFSENEAKQVCLKISKAFLKKFDMLLFEKILRTLGKNGFHVDKDINYKPILCELTGDSFVDCALISYTDKNIVSSNYDKYFEYFHGHENIQASLFFETSRKIKLDLFLEYYLSHPEKHSEITDDFVFNLFSNYIFRQSFDDYKHLVTKEHIRDILLKKICFDYTTKKFIFEIVMKYYPDLMFENSILRMFHYEDFFDDLPDNEKYFSKITPEFLLSNFIYHGSCLDKEDVLHHKSDYFDYFAHVTGLKKYSGIKKEINKTENIKKIFETNSDLFRYVPQSNIDKNSFSQLIELTLSNKNNSHVFWINSPDLDSGFTNDGYFNINNKYFIESFSEFDCEKQFDFIKYTLKIFSEFFTDPTDLGEEYYSNYLKLKRNVSDCFELLYSIYTENKNSNNLLPNNTY